MNPWIPHLLRAGGGGGGPVLPPAGRTMLANLTSSLILDEGTGGPTWSRATKAWGFNELGYLEELASGCAFFGGVRLVRNVLVASETIATAAWSKANCTSPGADTMVCANSTTGQNIYNSSAFSVVAGSSWSFHARLQYVDIRYVQIRGNNSSFGATAYANIDLVSGVVSASSGILTSTITAVSSGVWDVSIKFAAVATDSNGTMLIALIDGPSAARSATFTGDGIKSLKVLRLSIVDVTNYDASYVPEYVSVGVEASPYFGAGIDGAKYFETDWQGAPIAAANLLGFRREAAATNNLLYSRDLSNAAWSTKTNITAAKTATGLDGIANTATTLTATAADAIILQPITLASAARCASAYVKRRTGTGTISFTQDGGSTWTDITAQINSSAWSRVEITATLANPSVGFKIGTSGDAIDVDVVQNEAGAKATSPIVTTTSTVTRNADSLTFQTASNIDFAVGTAFVGLSCQSSSYDGFPLACTASGRIIYCVGSTQVRTYDGTTIVSQNSATHLNGGKSKIASSWSNASSLLKLTANGSAISSGAFDGAIGSGATINVGGENSAVSSAYIGPVAIYNYQMTDAELRAITT